MGVLDLAVKPGTTVYVLVSEENLKFYIGTRVVSEICARDGSSEIVTVNEGRIERIPGDQVFVSKEALVGILEDAQHNLSVCSRCGRVAPRGVMFSIPGLTLCNSCVEEVKTHLGIEEEKTTEEGVLDPVEPVEERKKKSSK